MSRTNSSSFNVKQPTTKGFNCKISEHSTLTSVHTVVSFIYRKTVITMVHCGVGLSLSCGHACTSKISNTQEITHACLFHSVATQILCSKECTFYFSQLLELHLAFVFIMSGKDAVCAHKHYKENRQGM